MIDNIYLSFAIFILIFFLFLGAISLYEREFLALKRAMIIGVSLSVPFALISQLDFIFKEELQIIHLIIIAATLLLIFLPIDLSTNHSQGAPTKKIDERDIMFSRKELIEKSKNYENYYQRNPDKLELDNKFRVEPGLLDEKSFYYDKLFAESANSTFEIVENIASLTDGNESTNKEVLEKDKITAYIKSWSKKLGALDVGITELKDYHLYSVGGRKNNYGNKIDNNHQFAIAFTVEMDYDMVKGGPAFPIILESAQQYFNAGQIAVQIATFIRNLGYSAKAHIDANYEVVCPLVAKDAGLGEIGRMGLLMTPKLGPRVRLGVVTTDLDLNTNNRTNLSSVIDFCSNCKKCADCCPSSAISNNDRELIDGILRWQLNSEACFTFWCKAGSDCGRCVAVCPYSHPNNLLHNFIRWGIKKNSIFRKLALTMDNLFYGKTPLPNRIPNWLK